MTFLVVANFKSNKTLVEVKSWIKDVTPVATTSAATIIVAPSFPDLPLFDLRSSIFKLAAQDVSPFPPGSYTGAVNANQLKDLGVSYCLVGHSERRRYFHETSGDIANKITELLAQGITPIVCLSKEDLAPQRAALSDDQTSRCLFCYEPPADIGGTETAPLDDIRSVTSSIKQIFSTTRVMYGGSVNANNIENLFSLDLSGVLVASASLSAASFNEILQKLSHAKI